MFHHLKCKALNEHRLMLLKININPPTGATNVITTVLPAKSDSDVMFVYKVIWDL